MSPRQGPGPSRTLLRWQRGPIQAAQGAHQALAPFQREEGLTGFGDGSGPGRMVQLPKEGHEKECHLKDVWQQR